MDTEKGNRVFAGRCIVAPVKAKNANEYRWSFYSLLTDKTALLVTPGLSVALLINAVQLYTPLSVPATEAMTRLLVGLGVESDCFCMPLKNHVQNGGGSATAEHVKVTSPCSETSKDFDVGPVTFGAAARRKKVVLRWTSSWSDWLPSNKRFGRGFVPAERPTTDQGGASREKVHNVNFSIFFNFNVFALTLWALIDRFRSIVTRSYLRASFEVNFCPIY